MMALVSFDQTKRASSINDHYSQDDRLIEKVLELREIQNLIVNEEKHPDSLRSNIDVMIIQKPSPKNPYYYFKAGYNKPDIFLTMYQFRLNSRFIHQKRFENVIYILIDSTEKFIPLSTWRKNKSTK
ncbi:MAG TPA: hypothetical protein VMU83_13105 [Hanamia sp.]|nr:hypothetical protein [Hanamia sp.]